jgi:hypothetical protein
LNGTYALVDFQESPARGFTSNAQTAPYHFLAFFPPSVWSEMAFNAMPDSATKVTTSLGRQMYGHTFKLEADRRIFLNRGPAVQFVGTCAISLQNGNGFNENDLILAGSATGVESEIHELYRRWAGGPVPAAVSTFDPAPKTTKDQPADQGKAAAASAEPQASMPEKPVPLRVQLVNLAGHNGPEIGLQVTNTSHSPVSAFLLVVRGKQTAQRWKDWSVDACLQHRPAWQPGQQWTQNLGIPIAVGNVDV